MEKLTETQKRNARKRRQAERARLTTAVSDLSSSVADVEGSYTLELQFGEVLVEKCSRASMSDYLLRTHTGTRPKWQTAEKIATVREMQLECDRVHTIKYVCPFKIANASQMPTYMVSVKWSCQPYQSFDFVITADPDANAHSISKALEDLNLAIEQAESPWYIRLVSNDDGKVVREWHAERVDEAVLTAVVF